MQKPRIREVCKEDYGRGSQDLLLDVLEWFEASPHLTAPHQTQLQRYRLLQDALGRVDLSGFACRLASTASLSSLEGCNFSVEFGSGRLSRLPIVIAKTSCKGLVTSVSVLEDADKVLDEIGESREGNIQKQNLQILQELQCELCLKQSMFGFLPESSGKALQLLQNRPNEQPPSSHPGTSWSKIGLQTGGWGIASAGVEAGDRVQTVVVGQTLNNTGICCSLVLRDAGGGLFSVVGLALDHLGFDGADRRRPGRARAAPMPPRRPRGSRNLGLRLAMEPPAALRLGALGRLRTLGYGWVTSRKMAW
ncbi:hypothetical protein F4781DRAFT_426668 [Annulohypoxylon bovei var. microspora]|nr:hypothetical protein F4781DRAFT_426668 [Annulohypoxylon bovei var. microspora]